MTMMDDMLDELRRLELEPKEESTWTFHIEAQDFEDLDEDDERTVILADHWDTYFPAFPPIAEGLFIKTSDINDKITPSPWPKPSTLDPVRLEMYKKIRGFGLPSRKIALDVFSSLKKR